MEPAIGQAKILRGEDAVGLSKVCALSWSCLWIIWEAVRCWFSILESRWSQLVTPSESITGTSSLYTLQFTSLCFCWRPPTGLITCTAFVGCCRRMWNRYSHYIELSIKNIKNKLTYVQICIILCRCVSILSILFYQLLTEVPTITGTLKPQSNRNQKNGG